MSNTLASLGLPVSGNDPFSSQPSMVNQNMGPRMGVLPSNHPRTTPPLVSHLDNHLVLTLTNNLHLHTYLSL